jgi:ADP-dependent NAD(P)H-hydrate dehydratase
VALSGQKKKLPATEITAGLLRQWPLPQPDTEGDKEERGRLLLVGGAPEMPGTIILAATAALRAGAGKVQIATNKSIALLVGGALLEARVFALPETAKGALAASAGQMILKPAQQADALVIGPGLANKQSVEKLLGKLLPELKNVPVVLDAEAVTVLDKVQAQGAPLGANLIITPHAGEMASLLQCEREEITGDPVTAIQKAVQKFNVTVVLKGAQTWLACPDGKLYGHRAGSVGLATAGSGDILAGLMGGLLARGASPAQAAAWAVWVHAQAGKRLASRVGKLGFLAHELLPIFPNVLTDLEDKPARRQKQSS